MCPSCKTAFKIPRGSSVLLVGQPQPKPFKYFALNASKLTRKIEGRGLKLYVDNLFSSPELFDDLVKKQIYCCGTFRPNRRGMPQDLRRKKTKLKRGDIRVRTRAYLMAILWWDNNICMLTNICNAPAESNFCNERGKAMKLQIG